MKGALIILAVTVVFGLVLYITHTIGEKRRKAKGIEEPEETPAADNDGSEPGCCGMHITCERDSLLQGVSTEIVYYDDEDLDAYAGIPSNGYNEEQIEAFRDVLLTLLPDDIAGWARSLQLRGINLPDIVKEELLLIVREERERKVNG